MIKVTVRKTPEDWREVSAFILKNCLSWVPNGGMDRWFIEDQDDWTKARVDGFYEVYGVEESKRKAISTETMNTILGSNDDGTITKTFKVDEKDASLLKLFFDDLQFVLEE